MYTVLLAMQCWLPHFKLYKLVIFTDNTAVYHGLCRRSVRGPAINPLRKITLLAPLHNIDIHAQWILTHENALADLLSRRDFTKLANHVPSLHRNPCQRPARVPVRRHWPSPHRSPLSLVRPQYNTRRPYDTARRSYVT